MLVGAIDLVSFLYRILEYRGYDPNLNLQKDNN